MGIYSINRPEWVITDFAASFNSMITVPLYDTLGLQALQYIINQVEMKVCCASNDKAKKLLENITSYPTLKKIIVYDPIEEDLKKLADESSIEIFYFGDIEEEGKKNIKEFILPKNETVGCICYTSGTTGNPKGAILTNDNLVSFTRSIRNLRDNDLFRYVSSEDVYLSYLPLAHVFERVVQITVTYFGGKIGFYQGDTGKVKFFYIHNSFIYLLFICMIEKLSIVVIYIIEINKYYNYNKIINIIFALYKFKNIHVNFNNTSMNDIN